MTRRLRLGGISTAIAALLSVLVIAVPQPAAAAHPHAKAKAATLRWGLCPYYIYPDLRHSGEHCSHLDVPLDYDKPQRVGADIDDRDAAGRRGRDSVRHH